MQVPFVASRVQHCMLTAELHQALHRLLHVAKMRVSMNPYDGTVPPKRYARSCTSFFHAATVGQRQSMKANCMISVS
jgi:hypothetical protein